MFFIEVKKCIYSTFNKTLWSIFVVAFCSFISFHVAFSFFSFCHLLSACLCYFPASLFSSSFLLSLSQLCFVTSCLFRLVFSFLNSVFPTLSQDSTDCEEYSVTALPTPPSQTPAAPQTSPAAAAPRLAVSGVQRHAQALRLGAIIAELEKILQDLSCADKELRALEHQILHLATILKVAVCIYTKTVETPVNTHAVSEPSLSSCLTRTTYHCWEAHHQRRLWLLRRCWVALTFCQTTWTEMMTPLVWEAWDWRTVGEFRDRNFSPQRPAKSLIYAYFLFPLASVLSSRARWGVMEFSLKAASRLLRKS